LDVTETDVRGLARAVARIEFALEDLRAEIAELRLERHAARDAADRRLATALAEAFGRPFTSGELVEWLQHAQTMPSRRRVADAVRDLVGGDVDGQRLGIALAKSRSFERVGTRGGCAVWMPRGVQVG